MAYNEKLWILLHYGKVYGISHPEYLDPSEGQYPEKTATFRRISMDGWKYDPEQPTTPVQDGCYHNFVR
jgi:hypothetical protein